MPCGSSYSNYSLTSQFLCVKGFGNICFERNLRAVLLVSGRTALFTLFRRSSFHSAQQDAALASVLALGMTKKRAALIQAALSAQTAQRHLTTEPARVPFASRSAR